MIDAFLLFLKHIHYLASIDAFSYTILVEPNNGKSPLVKPQPLPISKMENDCMNDLASCCTFLDRWIFFSKRGNGVECLQKLHF